ncbi:ATP-dependent RNA helicase [Aphelenchoides besseyi]|nr:ATP-dependent RNA helicase [Aphelenchoides besseyi]
MLFLRNRRHLVLDCLSSFEQFKLRWNNRANKKLLLFILLLSIFFLLSIRNELARKARSTYKGPRFLRLDQLNISCKSRLGNTFYREASLHILAQRLNRTRFVDPRNCRNFTEHVRDLPNILYNDSSHLPYSRVRTALDSEAVCEDVRNWNIDESAVVIGLTGNFFQCYRYFHEQKQEIRKLLSFSSEVRRRVEKKAAEIFGNDFGHKLCVHARRTDFLSPEVSFMEESRLDFAIPAVDFVLRKLNYQYDDISVVVFSDDPTFAYQIRPDPELHNEIYVIDEQNPSDSMELGSRYCDSILLTASSSTFGWWMAYLMRDEAQRRVYYNMSDAEATDVEDYELLKTNQNRKNKKAGGWQSLGLDYNVFKGISKQGYQQPTPIQRKAIPPILDGKDVVAMSRTGSGKTAAFVIPMLQKLKQRDLKGARTLLLSPTRELALQTFKVVKELGRFTGLRCACLVGGDSMDDQFDAIHQNPDIILATPGRLLHIAVEMNLKLNYVQYVVFDEADRLFEMGFMEQLWDILKRLPDSRQTLLFSATLPKMLIEFVNAGLTEPVLVRLDVDTKLSDKLNLQFFLCRDLDKTNVLLHLLRDFIQKKEQTIVFCVTIRHVEYYVALLKEADLDCSYLHSQLDPGARRLNIQRFRDKKTSVLVVTDVAARGVDIPLLDNAINVHFPSKPKLFVHRVGRVARAGKTGSAFSLVTYEELPYVIDFFLFLGRELKFATDGAEYKENEFVIGKYPEELVHKDTEFLKIVHERALEMSDLRYKSENAMKKYNKTKQPPSAESVRRVKKDYRQLEVVAHPYFKDSRITKAETDVLTGLKNWRPNATIFELNIGSKNEGAQVMKAKRKLHQRAIENKKNVKTKSQEPERDESAVDEPMEIHIESADENDLANAFTEVISGRKFDPEAAENTKKTKRKRTREEEREREKHEHFIAYTPSDHFTERALKVDGNFENSAKALSIDINADDDKGMYRKQHSKKWDRKAKKFVSGEQNSMKRIRTEEGTWVPASYKSGRYDQWMQKQKVSYADEEDEHDGGKMGAKRGRRYKPQQTGAKVRSERRTVPQIAKQRKQKAKIQQFQQERRQKRLGRQTKQPSGGRGKR